MIFWCLPHERGGVSWIIDILIKKIWSSPRTWGCFQIVPCSSVVFLVFPTNVGVFLKSAKWRHIYESLPHERGGVSLIIQKTIVPIGSSPRTWGCFCETCANNWKKRVFPTNVGVFPRRLSNEANYTSLPHERGGVSMRMIKCDRCGESSPRTWGCFLLQITQKRREKVFPTNVGVFLARNSRAVWFPGLPHERGGVSAILRKQQALYASSPRTWGCFRDVLYDDFNDIVFPTNVGVFPCRDH